MSKKLEWRVEEEDNSICCYGDTTLAMMLSRREWKKESHSNCERMHQHFFVVHRIVENNVKKEVEL